MNGILNNFYVLRILFIILIVGISISVCNANKNKYGIDIKVKLSLKNINYSFLIRILCLSFVLRILIEQTIYYLPIEETISNFEINIFTILIEIITTCLFAPIFEEIIFRFGLYGYLKKKIKSNWINMILTSILFSFIHFYGIDGFIIIFVISLLWNYIYFKTNNLLYSIVLHFLHNVYAMIGYIPLNNIIYVSFGLICLIVYIILKIKSSSKNTTTN